MEYDMYCRNDGDKWQVAARNERRKMTAAHGNEYHSMENDRKLKANDDDKWQVAARNERRKMTAAHGNEHHSMENDR